MKLQIEKNSILLFQGDSITDKHRNRSDFIDLGFGYVKIIDSYIKKIHPDMNLQVFNRGISGNKTSHLIKRWDKNMKEINPNVLSLLVGVNDSLRRYDRFSHTTEKTFMDNYKYLIETSLEFNPDLKIMLMTPFLVPINNMQEICYKEDLLEKIEIVKFIAGEYSLPIIILQDIFDEVISSMEDKLYYCADGIHPTIHGHKLMAIAWLKNAEFLK